MIDWWPATPFTAAIVASVALPLGILLMSHGPWRVSSPMRRYLLAALIATATFALLLTLLGIGSTLQFIGAMVLYSGSVVAVFVFWTLVAWGFSLSMLRCLGEARSLPSVGAWCDAYTQGAGIAGFSRDRCRLLSRFRLAELGHGDTLAITARGRVVSRIARSGRALFGLA